MPFDDYIGNSFRRTLVPEYKIHRRARNEADPFNDSFKKQKEIILSMIEHVFPVYSLKYKGYEADDLIAMICKIASDNVNIVVWSNDNDLIQIQQKMPNVRIWSPQRKDFMPNPEYDYVTYKSLVGKNNEMPGVKGIGKKTAERAMRSQFEFIKTIASQPQRYLEYRTNKKIVDLLENELTIPDNMHHILTKKVRYDPANFERTIKENAFDEIARNIQSYHHLFFNIQMKNNKSERDWFFNRKESAHA